MPHTLYSPPTKLVVEKNKFLSFGKPPTKSVVIHYDTYLKYSPSMVEVSIVAGAIAFVVLIYNVAEKYYFVAHEN